MSIYAPFRVHHNVSPSPLSFEREVQFETLGCCWALSVKNVNNAFPVQLLLDLDKVELLYGRPTAQFTPDKLSSLVQTFAFRRKGVDQRMLIENHVLGLIDEMDTADFLSFHSGMHDAVEQLLKHEDFWDEQCEDAYMALRYFSLNLLEGRSASRSHKRIYAEQLADFIIAGQGGCRKNSRSLSTLY